MANIMIIAILVGNIQLEEQLLDRYLVVCREPSPRLTTDGIEILPWTDFLEQLWKGE